MAKGKSEDPIVTLRMPVELKSEIQERAKKKGLTLSMYVREVMTEVVEGTICKVEKDRIKQLEDKEFLRSREFMQLIVWMYTKRQKKEYDKDRDHLDDHIKTLKQVGDYVPKPLSVEFDKVLKSLLSIDRENRYSTYAFIGTGYNPTNEFDFETLEEFLLKRPITVPILPQFPFKK